MSLRPFVYLPLALSLGVAAASAEGPAIDHKEMKCIVAGKFARMDACFLPADVATARLYFRVQGTPAWYYVDMKREQACHAGVLPKAQKKLAGQHIEYYVEAADKAFASARTAEFAPLVVKSARECGKDLPVAPISPTGPPAVFPSLPAAFAAAPGGLSTLAVVGGLAGAGAVAGTTAAVAGGGDKDFALQVSRAGAGGGTITSAPAGINCGGACSSSFKSGTTVTLSAQADAGSTFAGWEGACSGTGACTLVMDAARSVSARFVRGSQSLTVTRSGNGSGTVTSAPGGINCGSACTASFDGGAAVVLTAQAAAGSVFAGWSGSGCSGTGPCTVTLDTARSVDAAFTTAAGIRLTVAKAGDGAGTVSSDPEGIACGAACTNGFAAGTRVTLRAQAANGSTFAGWSGGGCSGTGECTLVMDESRVVTATFTAQITLTVTVRGNGTGTVTSAPAGIRCGVGSTCSSPFASGTLVELTATPGSGAQFVGWTGDCAGTVGNQCLLRMDTSHAAVAEFSGRSKLEVTRIGAGTGTVTSDPPGINCGSTCSAVFDFGTTVTLTANPAPGSGFFGWSGAGCGTSPVCTVRITDGVSVTAKFEPATFTLSLTVSGPGTVSDGVGQITNCSGTCTGTYANGSTVTFTPTGGGGGAVFVDWEAACSGTGGCSVPMTQNQTLRAFFGFPITAGSTGSGSGSIVSTPAGINCPSACVKNFRANTSLSLAATPSGTSVFLGWQSGCEGTGKCLLTVDSPRTVTANFGALRRLTLNITQVGTGATGGTVESNSEAPGEPRISCTVPPFPKTCSALYPDGTAVNLQANTKDLTTWTGCDSAEGHSCFVNLSGSDRTIGVAFELFGLATRTSGKGAPERDALAAPSTVNWTLLLDMPGAEGQVVFNGQQAAFAGPGVSRASATVRNGENRVEGRVQKADGQPGTWRFDIVDKQNVEPGSLNVLEGEPALVLPNAIVFRLSGRPGETVAFTFRAKVSP